MRFKKFKDIGAVEKRANEGKAVYGRVQHIKNSTNHNLDITFYKQKKGTFLLLIEDYNSKYAAEEGNLCRDERKEFQLFEQLLEFIKENLSISFKDLYYFWKMTNTTIKKTRGIITLVFALLLLTLPVTAFNISAYTTRYRRAGLLQSTEFK